VKILRKEMSDLSEIKCPRCGEKSGEIIQATTKVRRGWYCTACTHFVQAIGRERLLEKENNDEE